MTMDATTPARLSIGFLFPSWWEIEVTVATALLVVGVYSLLERISFGDAGGDDDRPLGGDEAPLAARVLPARQSDAKEKVGQFKLVSLFSTLMVIIFCKICPVVLEKSFVSLSRIDLV